MYSVKLYNKNKITLKNKVGHSEFSFDKMSLILKKYIYLAGMYTKRQAKQFYRTITEQYETNKHKMV